jgi:hypothetical protein
MKKTRFITDILYSNTGFVFILLFSGYWLRFPELTELLSVFQFDRWGSSHDVCVCAGGCQVIKGMTVDDHSW